MTLLARVAAGLILGTIIAALSPVIVFCWVLSKSGVFGADDEFRERY